MKQTKFLIARCLTLLILALLSTNLASAGDTWTRVTTIKELTDGGTFIMGYEATAKSGVIVPLRSADCNATTTANGYFYTGTTAKSSTNGTIDMSKVTTTSDYEIYISSPESGKINIQMQSSTGNYYGATSGGTTSNKGRLYTSGSSNETKLTPEFSSETNNQFKLTAGVSGQYKYLKYNSSDPRYAFYNNITGSNIVFYKKQESAKTQAYLRWEDAADLTCYMGGTFTRIAKLYDAETGGTEITGQTITYSTNTSNYASVDASGQVTPLKEGKATIVAALESDNYKADGITYDLTNKYKYESPSMTASNVDGERDNYKFSGTLQITLTMPEGTSALYYTLNDGNTQTYSAPFNINETTQIIAWAEDEDGLLSKNKKLTYTKVALVDVTLADENKVLSTSFASTKIILPTRQLDDYTFEGWSTTNCAVATKTKPNIINAGEYTPTESVTLYPIFSYSEGGSSEQTAESTTMTASTDEQILEDGKPIKYQMSEANIYSNPLRIYSGKTITFTGALISKIVLVDGGDSKNPITNLTLNTGQSGTLNTSDGNVTWTGSTNTVVLKASAQARTSKITVYYTAAEVFYITKQGAQNVAISSAGWATVCLPFKATITSDNATAYYVTGTEGNALTKVEATVIPAGEGILLKSKNGDATTVTFTISAEDATDARGNMMKGSLTGETFNETGYKYYILANGDNGLGFYYQGADNTTGASVKCAAGKAVLAVPTTSGAKAFFSLDNEPTGIESITPTFSEGKEVYNLNGMRVNGSYKGIVVVNGKKYINK